MKHFMRLLIFILLAALAPLHAFAASPNPGNPVFGNLTATGTVSGAGFTNFVNAQAPVAAWAGSGFGFTTAPTSDQVRVSLSDDTVANPTVAVCPVANCVPGVAFTAFSLQGATTQGSAIGEVEAVFGMYVNSGQTNGQKPAVYIGAVQGPLGGSTWSFNTDVVRNGLPSGTGGPDGIGSSSPGNFGAIPGGNGTIGYELDLSNWNKDEFADTQDGSDSFVVGEFINPASRFAGWSGLYLDNNSEDNYGANTFTSASWSGGYETLTTATAHGAAQGDYVTLTGFTPSAINGTFFAQAGTTGSTIVIPLASNPGAVTTEGALAAYSNFGWHNGIWENGATVAKDNAFLENTDATYGFQANGTRSTGADFYANGTSAYGIIVGSTKSVYDIWIVANAPTATYVQGTHTTASDYDISTSPFGVDLVGSYATAAINTSSATTSTALETASGQAVTLGGTLSVTGLSTLSGGVTAASIGATTPGTGAFTTLSASSTVSGVGFSNYLAAPPAIGSTTPAAGAFTSLAASGTVSGAGFSNYLASPPAIGATAANTGSFTALLGSTFIGGGSAATIAAGTGAGTSPTVSVSGKATDGIIIINTGTSPAASATIATITLGSTFGGTGTPACPLTPATAATAALSGASAVYEGATSTTIILHSGSTPLAASTQFIWVYGPCAA